MMNSFKIPAFFLLVILLTLSVFGNDGVYLTHGGMIYPTQETTISMDKEVLSFSVNDKIAEVNIFFEFNNPEPVERKLLIGFQAPTSQGDVSDETSNLNVINDFTIVQNGQILPYEIKAAECENCELKDLKDTHFSQANYGVFVYLFEVTFKPGKNTINHSYRFPASSNVAMGEFYNYILTTGSKWAGGTIKDLTVNIDMGDNTYFYMHDIFGLKADWSVIGTGKVTNKTFEYYDDNLFKMVRILSGQLQIRIQNFKPINNIEFGIIDPYSFTNWPCNHLDIQSGKITSIGHMSLDGDYSKKELRLLRNTIYAQHNYSFKAKDLKTYFSQFEWYMPNPNLKLEDIKLTDKEESYIQGILVKENR